MPLFPEIEQTGRRGNNDANPRLFPETLTSTESPEPIIALHQENPSITLSRDPDGSESICIDEQDVIGIDDAIDVLRKTSTNPQLTEYEKYNQEVAKEVITREFRTRKHRFLNWRQPSDSFTAGSQSTSSLPEKGFFKREPPASVELHSNRLPNEASDVGSIYTVDIERERSLFHPFYPQDQLGKNFAGADFFPLLLGGGESLGFLRTTYLSIMVAGPLGSLIGAVIGAMIYLCILLPVIEMMAVSPLSGGFPSYVNKYVHRSLGFAVGFCYLFACTFSIPSELLLSTALLSFYPSINTPDKGNIVWLTFFVVLAIFINLCSPRAFALGVRFTSYICILCLSMLMLFMLVLNAGAVPPLYMDVGFRFWDSSKSTIHEHYGLFQETFGATKISGNTGRFLQIIFASINSLRFYTNIDKIMTMVPEIRNPRKTLKTAAWIAPLRILFFNILAIFTMSINVSPTNKMFSLTQLAPLALFANSDRKCHSHGSPCGIKCSHWTNMTGPNIALSPWYMAFVENHLCTLLFLANAYFVYNGVVVTVLRIYGASRTLFGMAQDNYLWPIFTKVSRDRIPYVAVLTCSSIAIFCYFAAFWDLGALAIGLEQSVTLYTLLTWIALGLAAIRFRITICQTKCEEKENYSFDYHAPVNYYALIAGVIFVTLCYLAYAPITALAANDWGFQNFVFAYSTALVAVLPFLYHKFRFNTRMVTLESLDLTRIFDQLDEQEWEEDRVYHKEFRGTLIAIRTWLYALVRELYTTLKRKISGIVSRKPQRLES